MINNDKDEWHGFKSPCYLCKHRKLHCHNSCEKYAKYTDFIKSAAAQEARNSMTAAKERRVNKFLKGWH